MLRILLLLLIMIAGIIIGPILAGHQGYVLIQTADYNIETSITGLVIMQLLLLVILFTMEWVVRRLLQTGFSTHGWFVGRKRKRAHRQTKAALIKLAEGDYRQVERLLTRNAAHAEQPMVNYLLAAEAAQQRGDEFRTNQYLERAAEVADHDQLPVDITRVRIQLAQGKIHAARHGVDELLRLAPRHPEVLRLAEQAFRRTGAWNALLDIIPAIKKIKLHDNSELEAMLQQAYFGIMKQSMAEDGSEGLKRWWYQQNRKTRHEISLQVALIKYLIECNDHDVAQKILLSGLKHHYDDRLVALIPHLQSENPEPLEKSLRHHIKQQGDTPLLNSILGQFSLKHGEWEKARDSFRAALQQRPDAHDYSWLADALDKLHCAEEAAQVRHEALLLSLNNN